jgi:hypothetical protein
MSIIDEKVFEAVKTLPDQQAAEVLDFVERLKTNLEAEKQARRERALAVLDKYRGVYDGTPFDRGELHERP